MPDRKIDITISFTYTEVVDEDSLRAIVRQDFLTPADFDLKTGTHRPITNVEMEKAFEVWKAKAVAAAKLSFQTGNQKALNSTIEIRTT